MLEYMTGRAAKGGSSSPMIGAVQTLWSFTIHASTSRAFLLPVTRGVMLACLRERGACCTTMEGKRLAGLEYITVWEGGG